MTRDKINAIKLKIKSKNLAEEARIIKKEIQKLKKNNVHGRSAGGINCLREHHVNVVRAEARATELARAYLKGRTYETVEAKRSDDHYFQYYILPKVVAMVKKYGPVDLNKNPEHDRKIRDWMNVR